MISQSIAAPASRAAEGVAERFSRLERETRAPGWEGPRSKAIAPEIWRQARELSEIVAAEIPGSGTALPGTCTDGSVHLRWSAPGRVFDLEIAADGIIYFSAHLHGEIVADESGSPRDVLNRMRMIFR